MITATIADSRNRVSVPDTLADDMTIASIRNAYMYMYGQRAPERLGIIRHDEHMVSVTPLYPHEKRLSRERLADRVNRDPYSVMTLITD